MRMDSTLLRETVRPIAEDSPSAASPFAQTGRQPQAGASFLMSDQPVGHHDGYRDENRQLVRMLVGLLGIVSLVFMALFALIRF